MERPKRLSFEHVKPRGACALSGVDLRSCGSRLLPLNGFRCIKEGYR